MDYKGNSNLKELFLLTNEVAMIRRKKDQVLTQLPEKRRSKVTIEISEKSKKVIKKISDDLNKVQGHLDKVVSAASSGIDIEVRLRNFKTRGAKKILIFCLEFE